MKEMFQQFHHVKNKANKPCYFFIGKSPSNLFDQIHRHTDCQFGFHDFVSRIPPAGLSSDITSPNPFLDSDLSLHSNGTSNGTPTAAAIYICKRCLWKISITIGHGTEATGDCLSADWNAVKCHHWHTLDDSKKDFNNESTYTKPRKNAPYDKIEKCCQCDMLVTIRVIPCILNGILPNLRDDIERFTYPSETERFMNLFLQITRESEIGVKDLKISDNSQTFAKKVGDLKVHAVAILNFLGFEYVEDAWVLSGPNRINSFYRDRAQMLRDELNMLYQKTLSKVPHPVPFMYASNLWEATDHIAARLNISFSYKKNGIKAPASHFIKELEINGVDYHLGVLGLLNWPPDDTDEYIIWAYNLNSRESESHIPQFMECLVEILRWKTSEDLQQLVAIERSKGNHPQSDIRSAFRILRIEDTHIGISDAALCRNFEWTFLSTNPPGNVDEAKQALKLVGEARRSDMILNFVVTGQLPEEPPANSVPMDLDEKEIQVPAGLDNIGNTCFLNSLLQCYFAIKPLRDAVLGFMPTALSLALKILPETPEESVKNKIIIPNGHVYPNQQQVASFNTREPKPQELESIENKAARFMGLEVQASANGLSLQPPALQSNSHQGLFCRSKAIEEKATRGKEFSLVHQMQILFSSLIWTNRVSITPQKVLADIALTSEGLRFGIQQDVGECHSRMMASLDIALKSGLNKSNTSLINKLFTGKLHQRLEYADEVSGEIQTRTQEEEFLSLLLNVANTVDDAMDMYFSPEVVSCLNLRLLIFLRHDFTNYSWETSKAQSLILQQ